MSVLGATTVNVDKILPIGGLPAGASGGGIIQIVSATKTDSFNSTSGSFVDIGLSVSITPRSTSNKIYIIANVHLGGDTWNGGLIFVNLVRGSTNLSQGTSGTSANATAMYVSWASDQTNTGGNVGPACINFIDSPATTSATTYKLQGRIQSSGYNWYVNRRHYSTDAGASSSITAMEVSG